MKIFVVSKKGSSTSIFLFNYSFGRTYTKNQTSVLAITDTSPLMLLQFKPSKCEVTDLTCLSYLETNACFCFKAIISVTLK